MKKISLAAGLAAALATSTVVAAPVMAQSQDGASASISYRDLNLATEEGQAALRLRMMRAAQEVCGINADRSTTGTRIPSRSAQRCYQETVKNFERQLAVLVEREALGG